MWADDKRTRAMNAMTAAGIEFTEVQKENWVELIHDGRSVNYSHGEKLSISVDKKKVYGRGMDYHALSYSEDEQVKKLYEAVNQPNPVTRPAFFKKQFYAYLEAVKKEEAIRSIAGKRIEETNKVFKAEIQLLMAKGFAVRFEESILDEVGGTAHVSNALIEFDYNKGGYVTKFELRESLKLDRIIDIFSQYRLEVKDNVHLSAHGAMEKVAEFGEYAYYTGTDNYGCKIYTLSPLDAKRLPYGGYRSAEYICKLHEVENKFGG